MSRPPLTAHLPALLLLALLLAGGLGTELGAAAARRTAEQTIARQTLDQLTQLRSRIEGVLNSTLYLASGVEAQIRAEKGVVRKDSINRTLAVLQSRSEIIRNIGLAPGNRITYIYPLVGNERALGLYYPDNAQQWPAIERVIKSRKAFLAGPVKLVQGGEGLIYRLPVFLDEEGAYWGMISTVIDADKLWQKVGLDAAQRAHFTILGKDASGAQGAPVLGPAPAVGGPPQFGVDVNVPGGKWRLLRAPVAENEALAHSNLIRCVGWGVTLALLAATLALLRSGSRLRRLNATLDEARNAAEAGARAKSSFLAMMSHEIRTPMNGILGMTHLLQESALPAKQADYARTAHQSAESLLVILDDILDYSKIEAGHIEIEDIAFSLVELLEDIAEPFAARARLKGLDFHTSLDPALPERAHGDPNRLRQILNNLLSNAIKFTEHGSVSLQVRRAPAPSSRIEFRVQDTGIGISPDAQARLFTPFVQADSSHARRFGGTGLGLSISLRLAQLMGSDIKIDSAPNVGSTFSCSVPMRPATPPTPSRLQAPWGERATPPRLMLISANAQLTANTQPWLTHFGAQTLLAQNADEAHQHIAQSATGATQTRIPDIFIVDDALPDYAQLMPELAVHTSLSGRKILHLTAAGAAPHATTPHEAELSPPLRPTALARCLGELLNAPRHVATVSEAIPDLPEHASAAHRPRILLVEDHLINRKVALAALDALNLDITCAENGLEAIEQLTQARFDLVLMDMQMPIMDGPEAATIIRDPKSAVLQHDIPIIALTANAFADHRDACLAMGMNDFLAKPFDANELRNLITRYLTAD